MTRTSTIFCARIWDAKKASERTASLQGRNWKIILRASGAANSAQIRYSARLKNLKNTWEKLIENATAAARSTTKREMNILSIFTVICLCRVSKSRVVPSAFRTLSFKLSTTSQSTGQPIRTIVWPAIRRSTWSVSKPLKNYWITWRKKNIVMKNFLLRKFLSILHWEKTDVWKFKAMDNKKENGISFGTFFVRDYF